MTKIALDAAFTPTSRTMTPEGYLCVKGIAARTGVYQYLSSELGLEGPERMVGVYRSPESVFSPESMSTYADKDVTNDHPSDLVNSETFRTHSVGHVRSAIQDGDNVVVDLIIKDQQTIDEINAGKAELSPGYLAEYVPVVGADPMGTPYEFEQRDIVINHVAVVGAARAGKQARIFDHKPKGVPMAQRKVFLDSKKSRSIILDEEAASVVEEAVTALEEVAEEAEKRADEAEAKADELSDKLESITKETSDAAIGVRVKATLDTIAMASRVVKGFDAKGAVSPLEIKRAAMAQLKPTRDWASKSEAYVTAAFDAAAEDADDKDDDEDGKKDGKKVTGDARKTLDQLARDSANLKSTRASMDGSKSYESFLKGGK
jgi:hypothetical protein